MFDRKTKLGARKALKQARKEPLQTAVDSQDRRISLVFPKSADLNWLSDGKHRKYGGAGRHSWEPKST